MRSAAVLLSGLMAVTSTLFAQSSFEVASVKPNVARDTNPQIQFQPGGRVRIQNVPLRNIINLAYQLRPEDDRLIGSPDWARTESFDIQAKAPEGVEVLTVRSVGAPGPGLLMLRALLAERFQLRIHTEMRELPIYALVKANANARLGPKLTPSENDCERLSAERLARRAPPPIPPAPGAVAPCAFFMFRNRLAYGAQPLSELAEYLSGRMGRLVVDRTGLTGRFDFELVWTPDQLPRTDSPDRIAVGGAEIDLTGGVRVDPDGPALLTALREQLGLTVESTRGPVEVFVIDHVERP
jgi:uncharacterized protein (TIGR03435 family)